MESKTTLTHERTCRPAGSKDKKKRQVPKGKVAAQKRSEAAKKAAETRRQRRAEQTAKRPDVEYNTVETTPYPRAGDNPEFRAFLEEARSAAQEKGDQGQKPKPSDVPLLVIDDVVEWVAWPFMLWAQTNNLKSLMLTGAEARSLAEPLTTILNRHGVGDIVPPDVLDGLRLAARLTPVMSERFCQVKAERQKRAGQGGSRNLNVGGAQGGAPPVQGAPTPAPKEV